jgi:hypothetical protein
VVVPGGLPEGDRDVGAARDRVAEAMAALVPHAVDVGVRLAVEPMHPIYAADRSHLHHRFLNIGYSQRRAAATMWLWCLSLAGAVAGTGLDSWFGQQITGLGVLPILLLVAAVATIVLFLTEVTSNTATAATFIPVLGGVAVGIGTDSMTLLIPAAFSPVR